MCAIIALIAGGLGFTRIEGVAATLAKILFVIFLILFIIVILAIVGVFHLAT
ncbi:MAG TPA: DUF1328 family protein [Rhodanobacteraceae bacterium]|nr:DUF1328 family protein [Rhodanobacteraceae bacterium]